MFVGVVTVVTQVTPVSSQVGIAAATLVCAAAVNPLRRRLQTLVDRRFNREQVDAVRTVERFAHSVNNEVDLEAVAGHLVGSVAGSLHPVSLSLWLAP